MRLNHEIIVLMQELNKIGLKTIGVEIASNEWLFFSYESLITPNSSNHIHDLHINEANCLNNEFNEFIFNPDKASVILAKTLTMKKNDFVFPGSLKFMYLN